MKNHTNNTTQSPLAFFKKTDCDSDLKLWIYFHKLRAPVKEFHSDEKPNCSELHLETHSRFVMIFALLLPKSYNENSAIYMARNAVSINRLKFSRVLTPNRKEIGVVDDIVVHQDSQQIAYVLLKMKGLMGFGDKRIPVPVTTFEPDTENINSIVLNIERKELKNAPMIEPEDLQTFDLKSFFWQIYQYFKVQPTAQFSSDNQEIKLSNLMRTRATIVKAMPSFFLKTKFNSLRKRSA